MRNSWPRAARLAFALLFSSLLAAPAAEACVGRKLVLGSLSGERDAMLARVLSILVHERTGTTVELRFFGGGEDLMAAVREGKVDLLVGYLGEAASRLSIDPSPPAAALAMVKKRDDEEQNLVWGKPVGCEGRTASGGSRGLAVPVVRKDTVKKFPALPRLLEKLGGKVVLDDDALDLLVGKGKGRREEQAAREWLREVKLI